jgi:hypothetical protein
VSQQTTNRSFDELARGLASGSISRGKALKLMGAALLGGTLASVVGIGEAAADRGGCKRIGKHCKNISQCCTRTCEGGICACIPDGDETPCADDSQCCSGNCANETCEAPSPPPPPPP